MLLKEACVENFTIIPKALAAGAKRVELCDNLTVGGTTVSPGVMAASFDYCHENDATVMTIIRPRGGNFVFNDIELQMMRHDLLTAKELGTDGVVIGCLTDDNQIDKEAMYQLLELADGLQITFHMAFDSIAVEEQFAAIDWLVENGVQRILTHGGPAGTDILDNLPHLKELVDYAGERLTILPGGGISYENCDQVIEYLGVNEIHGTRIVDIK
ncbi:copper homeostasis protein CutC [Vagococcus coleopterorum]|uniref:PF03932 family protein CutC n=1 Tax=Vagococcus coleopterorum TaxID=2714946 RepID=A0A6G8ALB9_9ENTE|nr:copper homeostasis protein CutC [Vagococcus coleopterorum]QIL45725.1 copper homeostasis protein CutC [Vagococcus coleopterorum]